MLLGWSSVRAEIETYFSNNVLLLPNLTGVSKFPEAYPHYYIVLNIRSSFVLKLQVFQLN